MLKSEFEEMIEKQVTYDTFQMYENMYSALPENINKQQFVKMLNIDAIPEDPEAIRSLAREKTIVGWVFPTASTAPLLSGTGADQRRQAQRRGFGSLRGATAVAAREERKP